MAIEEIEIIEPQEIQRHPGGRPRLYGSPEELEEKIKAYFEWCDSRTATKTDKEGNLIVIPWPRPYTISGLAMYLGMDRRSIINYEDRDEYFPAIACAREKCGRYAEEQLFEGNDRGAKFSLINNYGWIESQQIDLNTTVQVELAPATIDELKAELLKLATEAAKRGLLTTGNDNS